MKFRKVQQQGGMVKIGLLLWRLEKHLERSSGTNHSPASNNRSGSAFQLKQTKSTLKWIHGPQHDEQTELTVKF